MKRLFRLPQQRRPGDGVRTTLLRTGVTLGFLAGASLVGYAFRSLGLPETDTAVVYLLAVLLAARFTDRYGYGVLASLLSAVLFNYFFTEPYYSFSVNTNSYFVTFAVMTAAALITSALTMHSKQNAGRAREQEAETLALYTLTNRLTDAVDLADMAGIAAAAVSEMLGGSAACLCFDENGRPEKTFLQQAPGGKQVRRQLPDPEALARRIEGLRTGCDVGEEFCDWPIYGRENTLGVIRVPREIGERMSPAQTHMLHGMIETTALAMDRFHTARQRHRTSEAIVQERYRGNLLRAISHDLRTPLAGIMGAAEMLRSMTDPADERSAVIEGIYRDADWLHSLVENILSLTRLEDGKLALHKQQEAMEEVVGDAILHSSRLHPEHEITVMVPEEPLFVPMDAKLIRQVLINLLDNAVKHTAPGEEIHVSVRKSDGGERAVFSVRDGGEGIAAADLPNLFEMFYTSGSGRSDAQSGVGLGLTICDAIVRAHGGDIQARNRTDGPGAEFIFTLPLEENRS